MSWSKKEKVIVPYDCSEFSARAIDTALEIAERPHGVHVIHVLPVLPPTEPGVVWGTVSDESRREHATAAIREQLSDPQHDAIQLHIDIGDPGHCIADLCETIGADLVVIPSHGRTGISRMLIGSTAERVVRLAPCPVLVLRGK